MHVLAIDQLEPLAEAARARRARLGCGNVTLRTSDGRIGADDEAPFDVILGSAGEPVFAEEMLDAVALVPLIGAWGWGEA